MYAMSAQVGEAERVVLRGLEFDGKAVLNTVGLPMIFRKTNDSSWPLKTRDRIVRIVGVTAVEQDC